MRGATRARGQILPNITSKVAFWNVMSCALVTSVVLTVTGCSGAEDDGPPTENVSEGIASGCTSAKPIWVGGGVYGYPDNYTVHASIGVELVDANGKDVDESGVRCDAGGKCVHPSQYAFMETVNDSVGPLGEPSGGVRAWSRCVAGNVAAVYSEAYPRGLNDHTDETKYGETMSNRMTPVNQVVRYDTRLPMRYEYDSRGNTGNVNGFAFCDGVKTQVTRINAWATAPNSACGIHAYQSGSRDLNPNGYWWLGPLAAGQCNAPSQEVEVVAHVQCRGKDMSKGVKVGITQGKTLGAVNLYFP